MTGKDFVQGFVQHLKSPGSAAVAFDIILDGANAHHQLQQIVSLGKLCLSWHTSSGGAGSCESPLISVDSLVVPVLNVSVLKCPSAVRVETSFEIEVEVVNHGEVAVDASLLFAPRQSKSVSVRGVGVRDLGKLGPGEKAMRTIDVCALAPGLQVIDGLSVRY